MKELLFTEEPIYVILPSVNEYDLHTAITILLFFEELDENDVYLSNQSHCQKA